MKINSRMLAGLALGVALFASAPAFADHVYVGVGIGGGGYYHHPYGYYGYPAYPGYYPGYYPYYAPPPTVVYAPPPQVVYAPAPVAAAPVVNANQSSPTFTNSNGQTCREYQATGNVGGSPQQTYGTACLQPDGSWRIVQ